MLSVDLVIEGTTFELGNMISFIFITILVWILLHIILGPRIRDKRKRKRDRKYEGKVKKGYGVR